MTQGRILGTYAQNSPKNYSGYLRESNIVPSNNIVL